MLDTLGLIILIAVAIILVLVTIAYAVVSRRKKKKNRTGQQGNDSKRLFYIDDPIGNYDGVKYEHNFSPGTKHSSSYYKISIKTRSTGSFKIIKENFFDRFFKKLGFSVEINTHDREFDDRFFIDTDRDSVDFTREFFSNKEKRQAVHEIFDKGFNTFAHDGRHMYAMLSPAGEEQILDEVGAREIVANLITLSKNMPAAAGRKTRTKSNWKLKRFIVIATILVVLMVTAMMTLISGFLDYKPLEPFDLFWDSLKISLPLLLVFLFFLRWLLGGRSWPARELIPILLFFLFIFISSGFGIRLYLNGALDRGESFIYTVKVMDKYIEKTEEGRRYYAAVESWREGKPMEVIKISITDFSRLKPGESKVQVFVKPGKFNFPWLEGYRFVHQPNE